MLIKNLKNGCTKCDLLIISLFVLLTKLLKYKFSVIIAYLFGGKTRLAVSPLKGQPDCLSVLIK
jgi:hypothetical protein